MRRHLILSAAAAVALTACGPGTHSMNTHEMNSMPGMSMGSDHPTTGLSATRDGYTLRLVGSVPNGGTAVKFRITTADGKPLLAYQDDQTQKLHFYMVNDQVRRFQHVHAALSADGTWTARTTPITGGDYRMYAAFIPGGGAGSGHDLVLSARFTVAGAAQGDAVGRPGAATTVGGYTVRSNGSATTGMGTLRISISKDGRPVTDLQPYLNTFAHLTAIREGDLAFAHMHPMTNSDGVLTFHTDFPGPGQWRLFLQFQTNRTLHTAPLTVTVR